MRRFLLPFIVGLVLVAGCTAARRSGPAVPLTEPEREQVTRFFQSYVQAFNGRDVDGLMDHYADRSRTYVSGGEQGYSLDKDQLLAAFEMKRATWENNDVRLVKFNLIEYVDGEAA